MGLKLYSGPDEEPVDLDQARMQLRVDGTDEDLLIDMLIQTARGAAEHELERSLLTQTWELTLDGFQREIVLPRPPMQSVVFVKYLDPDGALQTLANTEYDLDTHAEPAKLRPAYGKSWPVSRCVANAVTIRYVAGWSTAEEVPAQIKMWILAQVGYLFENRESVNVGNLVTPMPIFDGLLDRWRIGKY